MKIFEDRNVYEAGLERMRWIYDNFDHVLVNFSGGKDSTVCLGLALEVARERGRLPVDALFIDQEAEWQSTIDLMRLHMADPEINLHWLQVPMRISNGASAMQRWLYCWEEGAKWLRPKEPDTIHENIWDTWNFHTLFENWTMEHYRDGSCASINGIRTEESPGRFMGLTVVEIYNGVTWGAASSAMIKKKIFRFSPIYDWSVTDVWKYIADKDWPYSRHYDMLYQHGVTPRHMRVSSLHHENAVVSLMHAQELEPDTWEALVDRIAGVQAVGQLQGAIYCPKELPFMFKDWREYRDHLLENLVDDDEIREKFRHLCWQLEETFKHDPQVLDAAIYAEINAILLNDYHSVTLDQFRVSHWTSAKGGGTRSSHRKGKNFDTHVKPECEEVVCDE